MKKKCPFCHAEMEVPERIGTGGYCRCGAYGQLDLLSDAQGFLAKAKAALGIDATQTGRLIELVDGGIIYDEKGEPVIIQWARKPQISH